MRIQNAEIDLRRSLLLYAISDGSLPALEAALRGGVTMVQLRAKGLDHEALLALARRVKALTDEYHVPLIINDHADIAKEIDAAGAHLGPSDGDLRAARAQLGPGKTLGATARTVEQALAAQEAGADYLGCGAVFPSRTKSDAVPMPPDVLREICGAVGIPVVAIGGIDAANIARLRGLRLAGFAVSGGIFSAGDIAAAARALRRRALETI
jgi:thiamine-phosphate diphosphorylase